MSRLKIFALAAALALGSLTIATGASARGGHFGGGHFAGGHFGHGGFAFHRGFGFRRGFFWGPYYSYAGCWRWHRVWTPWGWRLHRVNVCYYPSYYY